MVQPGEIAGVGDDDDLMIVMLIVDVFFVVLLVFMGRWRNASQRQEARHAQACGKQDASVGLG
jgi:uncharacterized membrane protein